MPSSICRSVVVDGGRRGECIWNPTRKLIFVNIVDKEWKSDGAGEENQQLLRIYIIYLINKETPRGTLEGTGQG